MKSRLLGLIKGMGGAEKEEDTLKVRQQERRANSKSSSKNNSRNNSSDEALDDENSQVFAEAILEEYKRDLKIQNKKVFQSNLDYRSKLQAMARLQKSIGEKNRERPFFIFIIDHKLGKNNYVVFNMKITEIEDNTFFVKS